MIGACPAHQNGPRDGRWEVSPASVVLLPWAPSSVATARWHLAADLREAGLVTAVIGDAALVLSELLSNAIRHARPLPGALVQVSWALCDEVTHRIRPRRRQPHPPARRPSVTVRRGRARPGHRGVPRQHLGRPGLHRRGDGLGHAARAAVPRARPGQRPCPVRQRGVIRWQTGDTPSDGMSGHGPRHAERGFACGPHSWRRQRGRAPQDGASPPSQRRTAAHHPPHQGPVALPGTALGGPGAAGARHRGTVPARPWRRGALRHGTAAGRDGVPHRPGRGDRGRARRAAARRPAPRRPGQPPDGPGPRGAGSCAGDGAVPGGVPAGPWRRLRADGPARLRDPAAAQPDVLAGLPSVDRRHGRDGQHRGAQAARGGPDQDPLPAPSAVRRGGLRLRSGTGAARYRRPAPARTRGDRRGHRRADHGGRRGMPRQPPVPGGPGHQRAGRAAAPAPRGHQAGHRLHRDRPGHGADVPRARLRPPGAHHHLLPTASCGCRGRCRSWNRWPRRWASRR